MKSEKSAANGDAQVNGDGGGIAAEELARRAGARNLPGLSAGEVEAWLLREGLARVTSAGLLVPTERTAAIAGALAS